MRCKIQYVSDVNITCAVGVGADIYCCCCRWWWWYWWRWGCLFWSVCVLRRGSTNIPPWPTHDPIMIYYCMYIYISFLLALFIALRTNNQTFAPPVELGRIVLMGFMRFDYLTKRAETSIKHCAHSSDTGWENRRRSSPSEVSIVYSICMYT